MDGRGSFHQQAIYPDSGGREALNEDKRIGEVYDFPISIISERTVVDGKESVQNRFVVEGNYKYKFNNGFIVMSDTHAACMNFVNALEKIPGIIAQYEERTAKLKADVPQLEAIAAKQWGKEDELKQLKSELAALDRKITAALAPKHDEQDGEENRQVNTVEAQPKPTTPRSQWLQSHVSHIAAIKSTTCKLERARKEVEVCAFTSFLSNHA